MMLLRLDSLPQHDLDPGVLGEQFVRHAEHAAGLAEQLDPVPQRVGDLHGAAGAPERRVLAARHVVVQHDEIADVLDLVVGLAGCTRRCPTARMPSRGNICMRRMMPRWMRWMLVDSSGSMKPLDKSDGDAVASPGLAPLSGPELDDARLDERLAFDVGQQGLLRLLVAEIAAAIHHAVADAMLQRNAPLPAGIARDRARVRESPGPPTRSARATALSQNS